MGRQIKAILFDKDGTLLDFNQTWGVWLKGFVSELSQGDRGLMDQLCDAVGFSPDILQFAPDSPVIAGTPDDAITPLLQVLPDWTSEALLAKADISVSTMDLIAVTDLEPLLSALRTAGIALGVATNDAESAAIAHLDRLGIRSKFAFVAGFDSGFGAKPEPGPLLAFAQHTGVRAEHIAMVGDSIHDLVAGRAAGMVCVGVLTGPADRATLEPFADVVLSDIAALPAWLAGDI